MLVICNNMKIIIIIMSLLHYPSYNNLEIIKNLIENNKITINPEK